MPRSPDRSPVLAAKRYRSVDHRLFSRDAAYTQGRPIKKSREASAAARGSAFGREVRAGEWARHEFGALSSLWSAGSAGLPVPYPVQIDGTEILMEFIEVAGAAATRLSQRLPVACLARPRHRR